MIEVPDNFLGLDAEFCDPQTARFAILPIPYEGTVSYAAGTAAGPDAICQASRQVECFDEELRLEFHRAGVVTLPSVAPAYGPAEQMQRVREAARPELRPGRFLLSLGGEHSITAPLVAAAAEAFGEISVLQLDAHADLRDAYDGSKHSHAAVMRRVLEITDRISQVGVRSFSAGEARDCPERIDRLITPAIVETDPSWIDRALAPLGERVYVTLDIDAFDPSEAPGTGTPEPGGLRWGQVTALLRRVCAEREVVAADIVEVRPLGESNVTEFLAARLAAKIIAYMQQPRT